MKIIWMIVIVVVVVALPLIFWGSISTVFNPGQVSKAQKMYDNEDEKGDKKSKKGKKGKKDRKEENASVSSAIKVINKWELPYELTEISGLKYLGAGRFACIQDEAGTIFIYDTEQNKIIKNIPFAGAGDYEGIAIAGTTAYVLRSDGRIYEVMGYESGKTSVKEYPTELKGRDVEGLCYDHKHKRLLLAIKGEEPGGKDHKGIYAFDLSTKQLAGTPVYKIDLTNPVFAEGSKKKKLKNNMQPSDLEINPVTGDIYVIEGASPKVLILEESGRVKKFYSMNSSDFKQAEGITFSPEGDLFISNEGKGGSANILKVEIGQ